MDGKHQIFNFKGEGINLKKNCELISYAIIFCQKTLFSIIELVFRERREFYLFCCNVILKDRVSFK